jgi:hypothetical protein
VKYAEGLGVKVSFLNKAPNSRDAAGWRIDGSEILIYLDKNVSKIETILSLIHELGHHVWFIHQKDRKPDLKFEEALDRQNLFECDLSDTPAPKKLRKKILETEIAATAYWDIIYKDTNMKFAKWKLDVAMKFDIWVYEEYYKTGYFPSKKLGREKHKELVKIGRKL